MLKTLHNSKRFLSMLYTNVFIFLGKLMENPKITIE